MLSRITKVKLGVFVAITAVTLTVMALGYVRLPQQVGIGRYGVDVELVSAGGLYPQASVTYRGVEVGKVTEVSLGRGGAVVAHLEIDNGTEIPVDSTAEVRSASVIGEQYVNFVPHAGRDSGLLEEGSVIPVENTRIPTTTDELLTSVDGLLESIPVEDLRTAVLEAGAATDGVGDKLGTLIAQSHELTRMATENLPATIRLLEDSRTVLATQKSLDPEIRAYAASLKSFAGAVEGADGQLRGLLAAGAPFMREVGAFAGQLQPHTAALLTDVANVSQVLRVYVPHLEHVLTVLPAVITTVTSSIPHTSRGTRSAANLWFKLGVDPPPCTTGFRDADQIRDPSVVTTFPDPSKADWCKAASGSVLAARGARNAPCPNGGRAATAAGCGLIFDKGALRETSGSRTSLVGPTSRSGTGAPAGDPFLLLGSLGAGNLSDLLMGLMGS